MSLINQKKKEINKDYSYWVNVVKEDGLFLKYVPDSLRDKDMCLMAVQKNSYALQYVLDKDIFIALAKQFNIEVSFD